MPAEYKPKTFVSQKPSLFIVDPNDRPRHDKATGEAIWGTSFEFRFNTYTTKNAKEEKCLLNHPVYGKEFWLETDKVPMPQDRVVGTVTVPTSPGVTGS